MLSRVHIRNFKSLVDATVHLAPGVNVLVGPNGSGKTNFLRALAFLSAQSPLKPEDALSRDADGALSVEGVSRAGPTVRAVQSSSGEVTRENLDHARPFSAFDFQAEAMRRPTPLGQRAIASDGGGLGAVVDFLQNERPDAYERFTAAVRQHAPEVRRVVAPTVGNGKVVGIVDAAGRTFKAAELADGLLFLLALSAACFEQPPGPKLVCFEEPERGVHPWRLKGIIDLFRQLAAEGAQVVVTTHSDFVVNEFRDFPEAVHLFDLVDGRTTVKRMSDVPGFDDDVRDTAAGSLWLTGLYGGVPR